MNLRVKNHRRWNKKLIEFFIENDIVHCEKCGGTFGIAPAHSKKRRFILTEEDYMEAALLCQPCHHDVEYGNKNESGTHERMFNIIRGVISQRFTCLYN